MEIIIGLIGTAALFVYLNYKKIKGTFQRIKSNLIPMRKKDKKTIDNMTKIIPTKIKENKTFIIKFEGVHPKVKEKVLNFLFGICYVQNINPEYVTEDIILIDLQSETLEVIKCK